MGDNNSDSKEAKFSFKFPIEEKYLALTLFVLVLFFLFSGGFGLFDLVKNNLYQQEKTCGDGTLYNSCSNTKPYFCSDGKLIDLAPLCTCPSGFVQKDYICIPIHQKNPKEISLNYTLRGEEFFINFIVYENFAEYVSEIPRSISYLPGDNFSRADFKIKAINEEEQKKMLMPLVIQIQNITSDKEDQMRIAISIVQNIPFGVSNKTSIFGKYELNHSRYPYEVLYDMQGICGEKTDLLAFLIEKIGYGTAFFYYPQENHEAFGIKCPVKQSLMKSGYCFIETTGPSIITDNKIYYVNTGKLSSEPEIYPLAEGESIEKSFYEYSDADKLIKIRRLIDENGWLGPLKEKTYEKLKEKYGLAENYYG